MALFICYCFFFSRMVFRRGARDTDARWRRPRSVRRRWCDGDVVSSRKSGNVRYFIQLEKASKSQSSSALLLAAADIAHTRSTYRRSVVRNLALLCFQNSVKRRTRQHLPGDGDFRYTPWVWSPKPGARIRFYSIGSTCSGQQHFSTTHLIG